MPKGDAFKASKSDTTPSAADAAAPERFDLQRWIKRGQVQPVKAVDVYLAAGLEADIRELDDEITRTKGAELFDDRLGSVSQLPELARRREALADEMESSRTTFKFRGLRGDQLEANRAEAGPDAAETGELTFRMFAAQCIAPVGLSWQDFADLHEAMGETYFEKTIVSTAVAAMEGRAVTVPFSLSASEILRTQES